MMYAVLSGLHFPVMVVVNAILSSRIMEYIVHIGDHNSSIPDCESKFVPLYFVAIAYSLNNSYIL